MKILHNETTESAVMMVLSTSLKPHGDAGKFTHKNR